MNQASWSDTNFYVVSEDFHYTILGEVQLESPINGTVLQHAVDTAFHRFPYFSSRLILKNNEFAILPNPRPHLVRCTPGPVVLGSEEENYHLVVVSYFENRILFHFSHCITDGIGRMPFTKSVLYYYLTEALDTELDAAGIYLADSDLFPDEFGEPLELKKLKDASPSSYRQIGDAFKISDLYTIHDHQKREFRFCVKEESFISLCRSFGASPNALTCTLLAQVLWEKYPELSKDIVVNLCVNMRPALENIHSHLMLLGNIPLHFTAEMRKEPLESIIQETRHSVQSQTCDENIRYMCRKNIEEFERIRKIRRIEQRQKTVQTFIHDREGFLSPTYTVSYVGRNTLGSLSPYVKAMYTSVDSIPDHGALVEITCADGKLFFSYLQDFSDDVFVMDFIELLRRHGLDVEFVSASEIRTPKMLLPEII